MMGGELAHSVTGSEVGESTARAGDGALNTVPGTGLLVSLSPESLVSSMTSSGRAGAGGRMRVCAA